MTHSPMSNPRATEPTDAERLRGRAPPDERPIMRQIWAHLGFLHWAVDRDAVAALLPGGLEVDTFGGVAYVGLVPFTAPLSRVAGIGLPIAPPFHELNLRTYVHRGGRDPGIWFFSLDAGSRLVPRHSNQIAATIHSRCSSMATSPGSATPWPTMVTAVPNRTWEWSVGAGTTRAIARRADQ